MCGGSDPNIFRLDCGPAHVEAMQYAMQINYCPVSGDLMTSNALQRLSITNVAKNSAAEL